MEAVEGPAVVGVVFEVGLVDVDGFLESTGFHQRCAEGVAGGLDPLRGLVVGKAILGVDGLSQLGDAGIDLALGNQDFTF